MIKLSIGLAPFMFMAIGFCLFAFRKAKTASLVLSTALVVTASTMYWQWGAYQDMWLLEKKQQQQVMVQQALKQYKGPEEIITKMEAHLAEKPDSPKGWLLLGKLYASKNNFDKANDAFSKAYALEKNNPEILINYMESLYFKHNQTMTPEVKQILDEVLEKWPNQLDALNFAAMDAYIHKDYAQASKYWQQMLPLLPDGSTEKQTILKAIGDAQQKATVK